MGMGGGLKQGKTSNIRSQLLDVLGIHLWRLHCCTFVVVVVLAVVIADAVLVVAVLCQQHSPRYPYSPLPLVQAQMWSPCLETAARAQHTIGTQPSRYNLDHKKCGPKNDGQMGSYE